MKRSPKMFYSYVRSKQRNAVSVTTVRNTEGRLSSNDTETSQILCDQFQQVYANQEYVDFFNLVPNSADDLSAEDLFTEDIVYKKLFMLNVSKSPGPNNIHPHLLKNCAELLAVPLMYIFQKSFQDSSLPDIWKSAIL